MPKYRIVAISGLGRYGATGVGHIEVGLFRSVCPSHYLELRMDPRDWVSGVE